MSKFMTLRKVATKYVVLSKKDNERLGVISFHVSWKKWIFEPDDNTFYDAECLKDIVAWLNNIKEGKSCN